mmetsp:Transcript_20371/g.34698  ORF Transcript_20371/g.34698 Transcript_20371/m.34698 type:complete len:358 (-) Transcript_20371:661-1734(-)
MMNFSLLSICFVALSLVNLGRCFLPTGGLYRPLRSGVRGQASMKWIFSKGSGSMPDMGGIGNQGEYYYIPSKRPTLKAPPEALGREINIPIFPRNSVLGPMGEEYLGVYEMRYRQLINDVGERGVFGHVYYSQENSKLALVGTLARIKKIERLEDGGIYVYSEGVGRFYLRDIKAEKPYLRARVQIFQDYCENEKIFEPLEENLLNEIRYSVKLMKLLYPQNNYTINEAVIKNRPLIYSDEVRGIYLPREYSETVRRSKFSFANMDMLKTDPVTKLLFLQEPVLEKRYSSMLKVLEESTAFLEGELKRRGVLTDEGILKLKEDAISDTSDLEISSKSSWVPQNFVDGDWKMQPMLME